MRSGIYRNEVAIESSEGIYYWTAQPPEHDNHLVVTNPGERHEDSNTIPNSSFHGRGTSESEPESRGTEL